MFNQKEYMKKYCRDNEERVSEYNKQYNKDNPLRSLWDSIKQRCYNPKRKGFKNYGDRGIIMCNEWLNDFRAFKKWCLENGYQKGLQIDRIDNSGNYEPLNCKFVTSAENNAIGRRRKPSNNKSGYIGVSFYKSVGKYRAEIAINKKQIYLGLFATPEEALQARIKKEIELFGEQKTNLQLNN